MQTESLYTGQSTVYHEYCLFLSLSNLTNLYSLIIAMTVNILIKNKSCPSKTGMTIFFIKFFFHSWTSRDSTSISSSPNWSYFCTCLRYAMIGSSIWDMNQCDGGVLCQSPLPLLCRHVLQLQNAIKLRSGLWVICMLVEEL